MSADSESGSLRPPSEIEERLLAKLLSEDFPGRDALRAQINGLYARRLDAEEVWSSCLFMALLRPGSSIASQLRLKFLTKMEPLSEYCSTL